MPVVVDTTNHQNGGRGDPRIATTNAVAGGEIYRERGPQFLERVSLSPYPLLKAGITSSENL